MATLQDYTGITKLRDAWPKIKANIIAVNNQVIAHVAGNADKHLTSHITNDSQEAGTTTADAINANKAKVAAHVAGTADKHSADKITYSGAIAGATEVKQGLDLLKSRVDEIITTPISGEAAAQELIDARGAEATLGDRLTGVDEQLADVATQINNLGVYNAQTDFVEFVKNLSSYNRLRFRKVDATHYEICVDDGINAVVYGFIKDVNDDFIKLGNCYVGSVVGDLLESQDDANLTGIWNETAPYYYTTDLSTPASFSCTVKGEKLVFPHRASDRGGIFEFIIDGDTDNKVTISTWALVDTGNTLIYDVIATGLEDVEHTIVATFKGADPENAPAGTPRGWINYKTTGVDSGTILGYKENQVISIADLLSESSNKEIAINITYNGVSRFNPEHDTPTTFQLSNPIFLLDGIAIDLTTLATNIWIEGSKFELRQRNYIEYPEFVGTRLAQWYINHTISLDGIVNYSGFLTALTDIQLSVVYPLMLPVNSTLLNRMLLSTGFALTSAGDESNYYPLETDQLLSGCFLSNTNYNYIASATILNQLKSMRINKESKPYNPIRFWQRASTPKLYWQSAKNWNLSKDAIYSWAGKISIANIDKIYHHL